MKKRILTEMAIYDEDEVFSLQPVADVTTTGLEQFEGSDFINHIVKTIDTSNLPEDYVLTNRELNEIYSHHCAYRLLKKAAFLALPQILQAKLVLSSWKKKTVQDGSKSNDNRVSGLMGAPITIDNVKYLCLVGMRKNRNKIITPYTITLKDANGVIVGDKKVNSDIIVPDSNNGTSAFGSTHLSTDTASLDANSPSNANIDKNNKTDKNESKNMNKKNTIRLTESELKKIITESVKNILRESNLQEGGFGNFMNRTFKGSQVNSIYQKYLSAWQSSYAPALKQLDAISLQRQQNNGIARASASFTDYYTSPITQCLNELQGGNLNITATIDRHFASIAKKCQQYGVQIPRTKSTAQPAQGGQQTASNRQQPTQGGQQTNQETLNSWIDYAKELAKELKLWQAGRGGENCYNELKETITRIANAQGRDFNSVYREIVDGVFV